MTSIHADKEGRDKEVARLKELCEKQVFAMRDIQEKNEGLYSSNVELRKNIERSQIRIDELEETTRAYPEALKQAQAEALGWAHADACCDLDAIRDPRQKNVPEMLARFHKDTEDVGQVVDEATEAVGQADVEETAGAEEALGREEMI